MWSLYLLKSWSAATSRVAMYRVCKASCQPSAMMGRLKIYYKHQTRPLGVFAKRVNKRPSDRSCHWFQKAATSYFHLLCSKSTPQSTLVRNLCVTPHGKNINNTLLPKLTFVANCKAGNGAERHQMGVP